MQLTVASITTRAMQNPDLLAIGLAAGFILAKLHSRRSGMGGMGGL
jgi:hypothetical protein